MQRAGLEGEEEEEGEVEEAGEVDLRLVEPAIGKENASVSLRDTGGRCRTHRGEASQRSGNRTTRARILNGGT